MEAGESLIKYRFQTFIHRQFQWSIVLKLRLLGRPVTTLNGELISGFISDKALALLCYLALNRGTHAREKLADLLWGDFPAGRSKANLRQALHNLQQLVPGYLEVSRKTAAFLHDQPHWVDVIEFSTQVEQSDRSDLVDDSVEQHLDSTYLQNTETAVTFYQGDFLAELYVDGAPEFEAWAGVERERLRLLLLKTLERMANLYQQQRNYKAAIDTLRRMLSIEPWHEVTHRQLMLLYARLGEYEAALTQFDQCSKVLVEELNIEPLPETFSLYERIRAARTITRKPLPPQPTPFVGRFQELQTLQDLLLRDDVRLVTISGLGGVGKTRLALAAAAALKPMFLEGIAFVSLTPVTDIDGLFSAISQALGIRFQGGGEPAQQILDYLREKETLLVLDNIEQIMDEAPALESILTEAPDVKMLVTSRRRLNLRWEQPFLLTGLPVTEAETVLQSPAGHFFLETAQRAKPDFNADEADPEDVHQICQMVEGLPLAIELAASWLRMLSCAEIAKEMKQDQSFFTASQIRGPERQANLWATFSYSWRMLSPEEQAVYKRLSVFRGGFGRQAAQDVAMAGLPILSTLVNMSLLRFDDEDRYQIHELLRQFAAEKLDKSEAERLETKDTHSRTYLEWLAGQEMDLKRAKLEEASDAMQTDWDNIRQAWQWAVAQQSFGLIDQSLATLYEFCNLRQRYREGKLLFLLAAAAVGGQPNHEILFGRLQLALGAFYFYLGMIEESLRAFKESEPVLRQADLKQELALNLMWTGFTLSYTGFGGQVSEGEALLRQSLGIFEAIGDDYYQARCLGNLANILASRGEIEQAMQQWQRSLVLFKRLGIEWGQAGALVMLGKYKPLVDEGPSRSHPYLQEGLTIARRIDHKQITMFALGGLGVAAELEGDLWTAQIYYQEALDYAKAMGHMTSNADHLNLLGRVSYQLGQTEPAKSYFQRSLQLVEQYGYRTILGSVLTNLGILERDEGDMDAAARHFREAIQVDVELEKIGSVLHTLSEVAEMERQKGGANRYLLVLLAYIIRHPLTTLAIHSKIMAITEMLEIDLSLALMDDPAALSLSDVIDIFQDKMLH
jgi:predicted ATPase/DNA-binding SARP family transcriptional activator